MTYNRISHTLLSLLEEYLRKQQCVTNGSASARRIQLMLDGIATTEEKLQRKAAIERTIDIE